METSSVDTLAISSTFVLLISVTIFAIIVILKSIKIVPESDIYVIERLGKYNRQLFGGLNIIVPIIDNIRNIMTTREQMIDIPRQNVITKDNVNITVDGIVFCKIADAKMATYNVVDINFAIANLAQTTLRAEIGSLELDGTLSSRDSINAKLQEALGDAAANWGAQITRVEISDISVPVDIQKSMNLQMEAEREKRAIETTAEAKKNQQIRAAEAFKQEEVLKAEAIERMADAKRYEQEQIAAGQQEAIRLINESMQTNKEAAEFLLAKDRIKAFEQIASSNSIGKILLPYEVTQAVGSMSVLGDAFFKGLKTDNLKS